MHIFSIQDASGLFDHLYILYWPFNSLTVVVVTRKAPEKLQRRVKKEEKGKES